MGIIRNDKGNRSIFKSFTAWMVLSVMVVLSVVTAAPYECFADEYEDKISSMQQKEAQTQQTISNLEKATQETKNSIALLQQQKEATQSNVSELKGQSASLQSKIEGYSGKLDDLSGEIQETEKAMTEVSSQIVQLNSELEEIRREIDDRQQLLKNRIRSVYEKGGSKGMIQKLVEANSFRDALNRYVYLDAMVNYDRQKIAECNALQEQLHKKISEVELREDELNAYQDNLDDKYEELEDLSDAARNMLDSTNMSINAESDKLKNYDTQLVALDKTMKSLESQTAAAQAQLAKQIAERLALKKEDTSGSYAASASELEWLAATIQAEADGESYTGKLAVGSVIMNRVKSSAFPNSVIAVIQQNMQFASYRSGKVELIISKGPNSTCVKAAQEVLNGARVGDYLFFMTKYYADYYGITEYNMIGNHAFFYRWVVKAKEPEVQQEDAGAAGEGAAAPDNKTEEKKEEQTEEQEAKDSEEEGDGEESHEDQDDDPYSDE